MTTDRLQLTALGHPVPRHYFKKTNYRIHQTQIIFLRYTRSVEIKMSELENSYYTHILSNDPFSGSVHALVTKRSKQSS